MVIRPLTSTSYRKEDSELMTYKNRMDSFVNKSDIFDLSGVKHKSKKRLASASSRLSVTPSENLRTSSKRIEKAKDVKNLTQNVSTLNSYKSMYSIILLF